MVNIPKPVKEGGADILSLFNTYPGMKIDLKTRRPALGEVYGGYSGLAAKPIILRKMHIVSRENILSIVGGTGITGGNDAAEYIIAGARAITIGSWIFRDQNVGTKTFEELEEIIRNYGMNSLNQLVGSLIL